MRNKIIYLSILGLLLGAKPVLSQSAPTKHALIIAIGNYPKENGWQVISSLKDVGYIKTALTKQDFKDIRMITDAQATAKGIGESLAALVKDPTIKKGDVLLIHVSSHGEQIADDNGDESDGFDETIVAYDAKLPDGDTKVSEEEFQKLQAGYFRDDDFGKYMNQLRAKLGPKGNIVVTLDNCHSGSGTRGLAKIRGGKPALQPRGYKPEQKLTAVNDVFKEGGSQDEKDWATYVVFSAARAEEVNYETVDDEGKESMGSLTYAISKTFENLDKETSYRSLFAKIEDIMFQKVPGQHPVLEGNGIDYKLFGGEVVEQSKYFTVDKGRDPKELTLNGGLFMGLDAGAIITFYPAGTMDNKKTKPLDTGIVVSASNYSATVKLKKTSKFSNPKAIWAFCDQPVYREGLIAVEVVTQARGKSATKVFSATEAAEIKKTLATFPMLSFTGTPELILVKGMETDSIIIAASGYLFKAIPSMVSNATSLKEAIVQYQQYKLLRNITIQNDAAKMDIKLVPVINGKPDTSKVNNYIENGRYVFHEGDKFVIYAKNKTNAPLYLNILDLQPDGIVNAILPNTSIPKPIYPRDLMIVGQQERLFDKFVITLYPPYGSEVFKIFISDEAIDMENIATKRDAATVQGRGSFNSLEKLVKKSFDGKRGGGTSNVSSADGSVSSLIFEIRPNK
ncbi:caspase family protein [Pedobacter sp. MW01-1-1]|uniref:caspase family protein n=1 Tax=Pedobacter sp. MW01-1-1 TaxID=3383027 RepID=UPI003FEFAFD2